MNDITATFFMTITQQGSQIDVVLNANILSYTTDPAYYNEYGMAGVPEAGGMYIEFTGIVSSTSFSADEVGSQLTQEHLTGTFTSGIITATLTGTAETTNTNGIVVTRTSSAPTTVPTNPSTTNQPSRYFNSVASTKGQAQNVNTNTLLSSGQLASGTEVKTGSDGIVAFEAPNQGGTVYLGSNSDAGWVGLTSEIAPDNGIQYMIYPPVTGGTIFPNGNDQLNDLKYSIPLDIAIAVLVFSHPLGQAAAIGLFVEGGAFLLPNGVAYVKENVSHLIAVPQGALAGDGTEYTVNVASNGTTTVQVISGSVIFMDPSSNNIITINTNQQLTLPPASQVGFTNQDLQSDVSSFNSASVNQWWAQATTANTISVMGIPINTFFLIFIVLAILFVVAGIANFVRARAKKSKVKQSSISESSS